MQHFQKFDVIGWWSRRSEMANLVEGELTELTFPIYPHVTVESGTKWSNLHDQSPQTLIAFPDTLWQARITWTIRTKASVSISRSLGINAHSRISRHLLEEPFRLRSQRL
jgi:hypothetical protein